jgi:hypothetical protein
MESNISDAKIIEFTKSYTDKWHHAPGIRDFFDIGFASTSHVLYRIDKLVAAGKLVRTPGMARSIYVK